MTLPTILICTVLALIIIDFIMTINAIEDVDFGMLFGVYVPAVFTAILSFGSGHIQPMIFFIIIFCIITIIHTGFQIKKYLRKKYFVDKSANTNTIREIKEIEVCTEPKSFDDKISCFKAYKINVYKQYKKEKWDEYTVNCIFSSKDILDELLKHKLDFNGFNADLTQKLSDENAAQIIQYFKFDNNYDGDIDLKSLCCTKWAIDDKYIYIIGGYNTNLELAGYAKTQFLCYGYKYMENTKFLMLDYSIDSLMHRIQNYFGI